MFNITLIFGNSTVIASDLAKKYSEDAVLINCDNVHQFLEDPTTFPNVVYSSLADLEFNKDTVKHIVKFLNLAQKIIYCRPDNWTATPPEQCDQTFTEYMLYWVQTQKNNVENLDLSHYNDIRNEFTKLVDYRKTEKPQLWIAGNSTEQGLGSLKSEERYGEILAKKLGMEVSFLASIGHGQEWVVDQIVRSDIRENDIVICTFTSFNRISLWSDSKRKVYTFQGGVSSLPGYGVDLSNYEGDLFEKLTAIPSDAIDKFATSSTNIYNAIIKIDQLRNFCKKINAKLLVINTLNTNPSHILYQHSFNDFVNPSFNALDLIDTEYTSADSYSNSHPGAKHHEFVAEICFQQLKKHKYI